MAKKISKTLAFILVLWIISVSVAGCYPANAGSDPEIASPTDGLQLQIEPQEEEDEMIDPIDDDEGEEPDHTEAPTVAPPVPIAPTIEAQIKQDWQAQFDSELSIINYYGTHNGYVALFVPGNDFVVTNIEIAGTTFEYSVSWTIYLWKDSIFHDMLDAYEQGLVTAANISAIGKAHADFIK